MIQRSKKKRCVCGRSRALPLCDGSHRAAGWQCEASPSARVPWCFVAGAHNQNLATRLAAAFGGIAGHDAPQGTEAERLVVVSEGTELAGVQTLAARVHAERRLAIALNVEPGLLAHAFPAWPIRGVRADEPLELWERLRAACEEHHTPAPPAPRALRRAFLSHAVQDEPLLQGPLDYLRRHYDADLFVCADSIRAGAVWHEEINRNLRERELLILCCSRAANASTYCAFEVGYALALARPVLLVSLDGSPPPAFVQHLHMSDVERLRQRKPWLHRQEALLEALLELLSG